MGDYIMSTIKANDIQNASGGIPTVKSQQLIPTAWVNFNGTGTVAIRDSEGVSSITDTSSGRYIVNFAAAMANANYGAVVAGNQTRYSKSTDNITTSGFGIDVRRDDTNGTFTDASIVTAVIMGGQA